MWRGILALGAATAALLTVVFGAQARSTAFPVVGVKDGPAAPACPQIAGLPTFNNLSAGVNNVIPGGQVIVCPGNYTGPNNNITISKKVTLTGSTRMPLWLNCDTTAASSTLDTVLNSGGGPGLVLNADGITVEGFVFANSSASVTTNASFSGYTIRHNVFENSNVGLILNSNGAALTDVRENCFRTNNIAIGLATQSPGLSNAFVAGNKFRSNTTIDVATDGFATTRLNLAGNISTGSGAFLALGNTTDSTVAGNIVTGNTTAAVASITVTTGNARVSIQGNILKNCAGEGIRFQTSAPKNTGFKVTSNIVQGFAGFALHLQPGSVIASSFTGNILKSNGPAGLRVQAGNGQNSFTGNIANGATFGCWVNGAASINNSTWTGNIGKPANQPSGICL